MKRAEVAVALTAALCVEHAAFAQIAEPPLPAGAAAAPATAPAVQTTPPAAAPGAGASNQGSASECFPPCREGYVCHQRQCISLCNPPCPSGQMCVGGGRCESAGMGAPGAIREPPLPPPTKPFADRGFFMLGFHYGFSGDLEVDPLTGPLAPTYGFNLRGDVPIERYLVLGPLFQFSTWRADTDPAPSRSYLIDIDFYARVRLPITVKSTSLQFWAGVPIGFTFGILGPTIPGVSEVGLGWNFGFLAGGAVHFTPKLGIFTELGWLQHKMTHEAEPSVYVRLAQWVWNVGLVFAQ